jgi:hypothetical protein
MPGVGVMACRRCVAPMSGRWFGGYFVGMVLMVMVGSVALPGRLQLHGLVMSVP